jgi:hypothetical protein
MNLLRQQAALWKGFVVDIQPNLADWKIEFPHALWMGMIMKLQPKQGTWPEMKHSTMDIFYLLKNELDARNCLYPDYEIKQRDSHLTLLQVCE